MDSSLADGMPTVGRVPSGVTDSWPPRTGYLTIAEREASSGATARRGVWLGTAPRLGPFHCWW